MATIGNTRKKKKEAAMSRRLERGKNKAAAKAARKAYTNKRMWF